MKKRLNNSARASALQITLALAVMCIAAILMATNFKAAPQSSADQEQALPGAAQAPEAATDAEKKDKILQQEAADEAAAKAAKQAGFYPALPEAATAPAPAPQEQARVFVPDQSCVTTTFPGTGVGAIPDSTVSGSYGIPLVISFTVAGMTAPVSNVASDLTLTHSWCGDLDMVLSSPGGVASFITVSRIGVQTTGGVGDSSDFLGTYTFTDTASGTNIWTVATAAGATTPIAAGPYRTTQGGVNGQANPAPVTNLTAAFAGLTTAQVNGTWTLTIRDGAGGDTGSVTAANLTVSSAGCATPTPGPTGTPSPSPTLAPTGTPSPTPAPTATPGPATCSSFSNATSIAINDATSGSPYPSNISVSGVGGTVTYVRVKLNGLSHTFPNDIDLLLVGPGGQNAIIMSDIGGSSAITGLNLILEDAASGPIPVTLTASGTFQPTNSGAGDTFPAPAPVPSGGSALSTFNGTNANGTWSLYVVDDVGGDSGTISGGWSVEFATSSTCVGPTPTPNATASPTPTAAPTGTPPAAVCNLPVQDFADITTLVPAGWVMKNNSNPLGSTGWSQGQTAVFNSKAGAPDAYISANYNNTGDTGTISNWLLTPPLTLQNGGQLNFWFQAADGAFPDRLQIRMSTNGNSGNVGATETSVGDFTTLLLDINPTYTSTGAPVGAWQNYTVTLSGLGGPTTGRLAFRYFVENAGFSGLNSDFIGIDSVTYGCLGVTTPTPTPTPGPTGVPTASPSPTPPGATPTPPPAGTPTPTPMCASPTTVLSQNFESGLGTWTAVNNSTGGANPALVIWAVKTNPYALTGVGSGASTETLHSGSGTSFAIANSDAAGSGVVADTTLTSPSFSLVGFTNVSLTYKLYYRHITSAAAFTEVSTDGGTVWTTSKTYTVSTGAPQGFVYDTVDLTPQAGQANVKVRFRHSGGWFWYYAVDDVVIQGCGPTNVTIGGKVGNCSSPAPTATPPATPTPPTLPPVPNVVMTLSGTSSATTNTDAGGLYSFSVASGGTYTVVPSKGPLAPAGTGINNVDVLAIQRHVLLITPIPPGCRLTAADVNLSASVNTQDVLAVQRFFLGFTSGTASTGQYKFSPASRSYPAVGTNQANQDYSMYVLGDVAAGFVNRPEGDQTPDMNNDIGFSAIASVTLPNMSMGYSTSFTSPVTTSAIEASENIVGFQGDFTFDERVVNFASEPVQKAGLTQGNWNVAANVLPGQGPIRTLRIAAFSNDFMPLVGQGTLFELKMERVSRGTEGTPLVWKAAPDNFIFINSDLQTQKPANAAPGNVGPQSSR